MAKYPAMPRAIVSKFGVIDYCYFFFQVLCMLSEFLNENILLSWTEEKSIRPFLL